MRVDEFIAKAKAAELKAAKSTNKGVQQAWDALADIYRSMAYVVMLRNKRNRPSKKSARRKNE